jgi:hypothetical protein
MYKFLNSRFKEDKLASGSGEGRLGGTKVELSRQQLGTLLAAAIIGSGLIAIGAVVAVGQQQTGTVGLSQMNIGGTVTTTTPPPVPATASAAPLVKAPKPRGF